MQREQEALRNQEALTGRPPTSHWGGHSQWPVSIDGEDEAQGGEVTCPGSHRETHSAVHSFIHKIFIRQAKGNVLPICALSSGAAVGGVQGGMSTQGTTL